MKKICVYGGSRLGRKSEYAEAVDALGAELVRNGIGVITGGGRGGLMGQIANSVLHHGGEVTGIIPRSILSIESPHEGLSELKIVDSMHERKALMEESADGLIALPGGFGTLEEILEVLTWAKLGFHKKPCVLFNVCGYYDDFLKFLKQVEAEGFCTLNELDLLMLESQPLRVIERMIEFTAIKKV